MSIASKGAGRAAAGLAVVALVLALGAAPASAQTVSASPNSGLSATGTTTVSVTGSGYAASTQYRIGVCSTEVYGMLGIPACGTMQTVTSDGSGNIGASVGVDKTNTNVHASIPFPLNLGQPASFTCKGSASDDDCELSVASHGGSPSILAGDPLTFN